MAAIAPWIRVEVRLRRYPCPALFDYLAEVPRAQRAAVLRHLIQLGWLAQSGAASAAGPPPAPAELPGPASRASPAPDPLEMELLQSLND